MSTRDHRRQGRPHSPRLREQALALKAQGLSDDEVAGQLGIGRSTVYRWTHPKAEARYRQDRMHHIRITYVGLCKGCLAFTSYKAGAPDKVAEYCAACTNRRRAVALQLSGPTISRVLALIPSDETISFQEILQRSGIKRARCSQLLHRLIRYGYIERVVLGEYRRIA